jgi:hypothetical protein
MKDGDKIRVKLPEGYELRQSGEVRLDPRLRSARLRNYILTYQGEKVASLHDWVKESARVNGRIAYAWTHTLAEAKAHVSRKGRDGKPVPERLSGKVQVVHEYAVRTGYVRRDDGGTRVLVHLVNQKQYVGGRHGPRRILRCQPPSHDEWIEREKLRQL